ncbi:MULTISPECIES: sulfite exporter TauE/SafE family protein [unclassified Desulfovibrio]|uniref:sulfite exporter TauE/SafE family protein n=1 Tax=unclassified Desulfovibrio TaxID=2593640 RepID=UPI0013EB7CD7|nr:MULTISPECIES: sulfite exporter TauE/SafE family protein [unclassified Desulfovibrio]
MLFPVSGVECSPLLPVGAAFGISFLTSMGGVSGAFLLLPFQLGVLGYVHPGVSATNQVFNIVACPSGVWRYWREGRLLGPLTLIMALGTLPGVFAGALIRVTLLPDAARFALFAATVLLYMAGRLLWDVWRSRHGASGARGGKAAPCRVLRFSLREFVFASGEETYAVSCRAVFLLSLVVGLVGGIYGIGGGAIMVPFLIAFFGLPVHAVAGASLFCTFLTSVAGVGFYSLLAPFWPALGVQPDWLLGLLFGVGGMGGMYLGARCQKFVSARMLKYLLAAILLFTAIRCLGQAL